MYVREKNRYHKETKIKLKINFKRKFSFLMFFLNCCFCLLKIEFPLKKSLELDSSLKVEKKSIFQDLNIPSHIYDEDEEALTSARAAAESNKKSDRVASSKVDEKAAVPPKPEIEQLEFKWDKKSTGSTDSLLQSDSEAVKRKNIYYN